MQMNIVLNVINLFCMIVKNDLEKQNHFLIQINKINCYCLEHNDPYVVHCNNCK